MCTNIPRPSTSGLAPECCSTRCCGSQTKPPIYIEDCRPEERQRNPGQPVPAFRFAHPDYAGYQPHSTPPPPPVPVHRPPLPQRPTPQAPQPPPPPTFF